MLGRALLGGVIQIWLTKTRPELHKPRSLTVSINRAELALGGLRSAEPRLGEPRGNRPLGRRQPHPTGAGATGTVRREPVQPRDRRRGIFPLLVRGADERRDLGVQVVHARIGMRPPISKCRGLELSQERLDLGAAGQRGAGGDEETDRELGGGG